MFVEIASSNQYKSQMQKARKNKTDCLHPDQNSIGVLDDKDDTVLEGTATPTKIS